MVDFVTIGEPFAVPAQPPATDLADFPEGGFGLSIMRQVSDAVEHRHDLGVNTVRLVRQLPAGGLALTDDLQPGAGRPG